MLENNEGSEAGATGVKQMATLRSHLLYRSEALLSLRYSSVSKGQHSLVSCQNEGKITTVIKGHGWGISGRKMWMSEMPEEKRLGVPLHKSIVSYSSSSQKLLQKKNMVNLYDSAYRNLIA